MNILGEELNPILLEIEEHIFANEAEELGNPNYSIEAFRASVKIFVSAIMDKMWELQVSENISMEDRCKMVFNVGNEIRKLVNTYTGIDTHKLYNTNDATN